MRLHPQTIIAGYRKATDAARVALTAAAKDNSADPVAFKEDLMRVCVCVCVWVWVCVRDALTAVAKDNLADLWRLKRN